MDKSISSDTFSSANVSLTCEHIECDQIGSEVRIVADLFAYGSLPLDKEEREKKIKKIGEVLNTAAEFISNKILKD